MGNKKRLPRADRDANERVIKSLPGGKKSQALKRSQQGKKSRRPR